MAKVLGLGGVFFKAQDTKALKAWYAKVLGVEFAQWGSATFAHPSVGVTNLATFAADTQYFAPSTRDFMINLIVDDLDGVLAMAAAAGETPLGREAHDYGKFAWLMDP